MLRLGVRKDSGFSKFVVLINHDRIWGPDPSIQMHPANDETVEILLPIIDEVVEVGLPARVILYNDEEHTFDEVVHQIVIATGCSSNEALAMTNEVHSRGKAQVYDGPMNTCLRVSTVLEEIALHTQVEF